MLVGLGGNNGTTFVAGLLANKKRATWETKSGPQTANFYGSFTQSATCHVGYELTEDGKIRDVFQPIKNLLPMVDPCDIEVSGWDISKLNLYDACKRARVLEPTLLTELKEDLEQIVPLKAPLNPDFIAANQASRADNCLEGTNSELV